MVTWYEYSVHQCSKMWSNWDTAKLKVVPTSKPRIFFSVQVRTRCVQYFFVFGRLDAVIGRVQEEPDRVTTDPDQPGPISECLPIDLSQILGSTFSVMCRKMKRRPTTFISPAALLKLHILTRTVLYFHVLSSSGVLAPSRPSSTWVRNWHILTFSLTWCSHPPLYCLTT
jgi:hypothetical protein